ncbi:MAG: phosphatase PAP2 family protein [Oligoflexus sp.]
MATSLSSIVKDQASYWLKHTDLKMLLVLFIIVGGLTGFIEIVDEVLEGEVRHIDEQIILALRHPQNVSDPLGPAWVEEAVRDITALGGTAVLLLFTLSVLGYLSLVKHYKAAVILITTALGGLAISSILKITFNRPRPDLVPHGSEILTASFPSGHSMLSTIIYLTLAAFISSTVSSNKVRAYIVSIALLFTLLIGMSRVYLGVHYPTDVLAGWLGGLTWALLCWIVVRYLIERKVIESN